MSSPCPQPKSKTLRALSTNSEAPHQLHRLRQVAPHDRRAVPRDLDVFFRLGDKLAAAQDEPGLLDSRLPSLAGADLVELMEEAVRLCRSCQCAEARKPGIVGRQQRLFAMQDRRVLARAIVGRCGFGGRRIDLDRGQQRRESDLERFVEQQRDRGLLDLGDVPIRPASALLSGADARRGVSINERERVLVDVERAADPLADARAGRFDLRGLASRPRHHRPFQYSLIATARSKPRSSSKNGAWA